MFALVLSHYLLQNKDKKICSYKYGVSARIKGGEKVDITAEVDIFCQSSQ